MKRLPVIAALSAVIALVGVLISANQPKPVQGQVVYSNIASLTAACTTDPCGTYNNANSTSTAVMQIPTNASICYNNVYGTFGAIWTSEVSNSPTAANGSFQPQLLTPSGGGVAIGGGRLAFGGSFTPQAGAWLRVRVTFFASGTVSVIQSCAAGPMNPPAAPIPAYSASPTPGASPT
jgi:hypothetical protein